MITDKNIFDWIRSVTGYATTKVIRANQNGPRPGESFVTWQVISMQPMDFSLIEESEDAYDLDVVDTRRYAIGVDINVYGSGGLAVLAALAQSGSNPAVRTIFNATSTALIGSSAFQDLAFLGDTHWEPRYQAEFQFSTFATSARIQEDWVWDDYSISGDLDEDTITIEP